METFEGDNAIWADGEWISWDEINEQIQYKEWRAKYPKADLTLVPIFNSLLSTAAIYHADTGKHLHVYVAKHRDAVEEHLSAQKPTDNLKHYLPSTFWQKS